jgi:hypothetical protein
MKFLKYPLLILMIYWLPKFCAHQTDGFTLLKIRSSLKPEARWETAPPPEDLKTVLNQPFTYLNSGGQCYAFLSEDQKFVVKFFKHHLRRLPWVTAHLPLPAKYAALREKQRTKRLRKLQRDFTSYKLAYEELKEESGLLYVHLNKTENLGLSLMIIDKLGIQHRLKLDQFEFVVQKRADLALDYLMSLIRDNKMEEAKCALNSMVDLMVNRCKKGIYDEDPRLHRNLGFSESKAMLIDVGRLRRDQTRISPEIYMRDLKKMTDRLNQWLLQESPELALHLQKRLHAL